MYPKYAIVTRSDDGEWSLHDVADSEMLAYYSFTKVDIDNREVCNKAVVHIKQNGYVILQCQGCHSDDTTQQ